MATMLLYSVSTEEELTVTCFLDFQDIRNELRNTQYPGTNFLVIGHEAQSKLEYTAKWKLLEAEKKNPLEEQPLRYFNTCRVVHQ